MAATKDTSRRAAENAEIDGRSAHVCASGAGKDTRKASRLRLEHTETDMSLHKDMTAVGERAVAAERQLILLNSRKKKAILQSMASQFYLARVVVVLLVMDNVAWPNLNKPCAAYKARIGIIGIRKR